MSATSDEDPAGLLRRARGGAATYARATAEDAVELGAVFWHVAHRQARDAAGGLGGRLGRSLRGPGLRRRSRRSPDRRG